jgi:hypothetical protein
MIGSHIRQVALIREPVTRFQGLRVPVALILCQIFCLQACATTSAAPSGAVLSRSVTEEMVELQADPETASHLPNAAEVAQLRDPRVIPVSLVIRNVGTADVWIESALIGLQLSDGRVLRVAEGVQTARAPAFDFDEGTDGLNWIGSLGEAMRDLPQVILPILMVVVGTMPLWLPPYLIARHVKRTSREQLNRNAALAGLGDLRLATGQAAGGVFYFAIEGDPPPTLTTTTLIVPIHRADTKDHNSVRLPLGKVE